MRCHASVAHNQILNGASVISSPFIGVELTCWEARIQPQATAVFDPFLPSRKVKDLAKNIMRCRAGWRAKLAT
jgi:hypothetical protein